MLGFFPDPYPEEVFYSLCARFSERMGYTTLRQVVEELFGDGQVIATVAFPSHLDQLVARLPPGSGYTAASLIADHTLLPFFGPFLPPTRLIRLSEDMRGKRGPALHMRAGVMASTVPLPSALRYCPCCVEEDRTRFGETYWHRLFQLPGVLVCPDHQVWLEESPVAIQHRQTRQVFVSAEQALQVLPLPRPIQGSPAGQVHLALARDAAWLLSRLDLAPGLELFHQQYLHGLFEKHLATYRGRITMTEFQEQFLSSYPQEVLHNLHCALDLHSNDHWLARLVRKPKGAHHPLHHLLLIHFLGYTAEDFFTRPAGHHPFGEHPWPCLNPVCRFYRKPVIKSCQIVYPSSMGGHPTGIFACACGFVYARSGPDVVPADRFRRGKIVQFGPLWDETLRQLWLDPLFSVNAMARRLEIDPLTVKRSAVRLGLPLTRRYEDALIQLKPLAPSDNAPEEVLTPIFLYAQRNVWLTAIQAHPNHGTKALRSLLPGLYTWLYRHDRTWLQGHQPARKRVQRGLRANWENRDSQLAGEVAHAAAALKGLATYPMQVTVAAIGRNIRQLALLQEHLGKLPVTAATLAEAVETRETFALRRIHWATTRYLEERYYPQRWELIRYAGLARVATWPTIEAAIDRALQTLKRQICENATSSHTSCLETKG